MLLPKQFAVPNRKLYIVFCVVVVAIGIAVSVYTYIRVDKNSRSHIVDRTSSIAQAISAQDIKALTGTETDLVNPTYLSIKKLLTNIHAVNKDARFLYLIGQHPNGTLFFYADSENTDSVDYSPPGQEYDEAPETIYATFREGVSNTDGPTRDRWGIWVSGYSPIFDAQGKVVAILGMDIPGRQHILNSLVYSLFTFLVTIIFLFVMIGVQYNRRKEVEYIEQKAEFLSIAAHEIRTPLTGIRWALENLLTSQKANLDEQTAATVYLAESNTSRLIERLNNLLTVTRLENATNFKLRSEPIIIQELLEEIVGSLTLTAQGRGIKLAFVAHTKSNTMLVGDRENLRYAFSNILSNAIKYTYPNTTIAIHIVETDKATGIKITDTGPGISPEEQKHIFDGYHRAKEAIASGQTGTGLGLYLTKKIILLHGGTIDVISHVGSGTSFICTFPKKK